MGQINESDAQASKKQFIVNSIEATIRVGLVLLIFYLCIDIVRPFLIPILWGLIIATSLYPIHIWLAGKLGNKENLTAIILTFAGLAILVYPVFKFSGSMVQSLQKLFEKFDTGFKIIPTPAKTVQDWPLVGTKIYEIWHAAASDLESVLLEYKSEIASFAETLLANIGMVGIGFVQFVAAIIISGFVLSNSAKCIDFTSRLMVRLAGEKGHEYARISGQIVSGVTRGILGVSFLQSAIATAGFVVMDIPVAGFWGLLCLILAIIQIGAAPVIIGVAIYVLSTHDSTIVGVLFLIWSIAVGLMDNVLKPLLMGKGIDVPTVIIFLGAIGGFMASGIIGLFTGAVILVIGYSLFSAWLNEEKTTEIE